MTKTEKKRRLILVNQLKEGIEKLGLRIDSYGNWKHPYKLVRVKFKKNVIRIEHKGFDRWERRMGIHNCDISEGNVLKIISTVESMVKG